MLYPTLTQVELLKFFPKASVLLKEDADRGMRIENLVYLTTEQIRDAKRRLTDDNILIIGMNEYPRLEGHEEKNLSALLATYLRNTASDNEQDMERKISRVKMIAECYPEGITTTIVPISGHKQRLQGAVCIGHTITFPIEHELFNKIHRGDEVDTDTIIPAKNTQDKTLPFFIESLAVDTIFGYGVFETKSPIATKTISNISKFLSQKRNANSTGISALFSNNQAECMKQHFGFTQEYKTKNSTMLARRWSNKKK